MNRPFFTLLAFAVALLFGIQAHAQSAKPGARGLIALTPGSSANAVANQPSGTIELTAREGGYYGEFSVHNLGAEPLTVSRIAVRGDDDDVRAPARLAAHFASGDSSALTIAPNQKKSVLVTWLPEKDPRMKQVFAHVVVTSSDEAAGEVAMGVKAQIPQSFSFVTHHVLSWITFLPLLGFGIAVAMRLLGRKDDSLRYVALAITGAQCLLALWMYDTFNPDVTRADGNDGFQFIEHAVWIRSLSVEYFLGVDGASMPMVLSTSLLAFVGVLASFGVEKQLKGFYAVYFLLLTGMMGVAVSLDLLVFYGFWQLMLVAMFVAIGVWGGPKKEYAATKFVLYTLVGSALMLVAFIALCQNADRTFLVDGTSVSRTFSIPELMRVSYNAKHLTLLGVSFVKVIWIALFVSFAIVIPMFPFHTWLPDALAEAPPGVNILLAGVLLKLGTYGILRVNFGILPEATRWAAGTVVAFGVVNVIYGAFCALAQKDLKRLIAYGSMSQMGFCLIGLGSLTPQGIAACLVQMFNHGIIVAMLLILANVIQDRVRTRDIDKLGGLAGEMPLYAMFFGFALVASLGMPGLAGFWGEALALFGAFAMYRMLTAMAALGLVLTAAYHLWTLQRVLFGKFADSWRSSPYLEPFGGKFPEITPREIASLAPLAMLCIIVGFWPVPLFSLISGGVRDLTGLVNPPGPDQIAMLFR